jgi:hypothetical protein
MGSAVYETKSDCWNSTFKEQQGPFGALTPFEGQFFQCTDFPAQRQDGTSGFRRHLIGNFPAILSEAQAKDTLR